MGHRNSIKYDKSGNVRSEGLEVYRYPNDVGSNEYPNYIMFTIIKRASDIGNIEAEAIKGRAVQGHRAVDALYGMKDTTIQHRPDLNTSLAATIGSAAGLVGGLAGGRKLTTNLSQLITAGLPAGRGVVEGAATVAGNVVGVGVGILAGSRLAAQGLKRERITLKKTIALHLNNKPSVNYKADWADTDLGIIGGASKVFGEITAPLKKITAENLRSFSGALSIINNVRDAGNAAFNGMGGAAAVLALKNVNEVAGDLGDVRGFFEAGTGVAVNPYKAQLFKNMAFRTFSFDYVFLPRDEAEYESVQTIIKTFKQYMHPTLGKENFFMGYPAEFDITYFHKNGPNYENIFKISSCALTDLKVEYGGADFVTFKGMSGAPTEIAMSLSFLELELLTEERIKDGY